MNFLQLAKIFPGLVNSGVSIELISQPGLGKSEFVEQMHRKMEQTTGEKWGLAKLFLATTTPVDMMGYMVPEHRDGKLYSSFTIPPWMQTVDGRHVGEFKRGFLFLDEYGQGEGDTKRVSAELLRVGEIGPHKLNKTEPGRPGWTIIAASNRVTDRSGVNKSFDFIINRRIEFNIQPDLASFEQHALKAGLDPLFLTFAVQYPEVVFKADVPEKQGPWCTPRSLFMLENVWRNLKQSENDLVFVDEKGKTRPEMIEVASGLIGTGPATQFGSHLLLEHELPKCEEIVKDPMKAKLPTNPGAQMLISYQLAHRANEKNVGPLIDYIGRLPQEFAITFGQSACMRDPDLVNTPEFDKWCRKNASLMVAISAVNRA